MAPFGSDRRVFPLFLLKFPNPPEELWMRGDVSICDKPAVAIVGSRAASRGGMAIASAIAGDLARAGIVVVSGLARGIDSAAHVAALDAGGKTIAVLGTGIDVVYPAEHRELTERIARDGAADHRVPARRRRRSVSHFPRRNRIISGLSRGVVVVEAAEKSGSLITARLAADQGRDVMVVPGPVLGGRNRGGHALIRDGAKLVESAVDILQELGWNQPQDWPARRSPEGEGGESVEFTVDDVAQQLELPAGEALARLLEWELTGEIRRIGSGRFVRSPRRKV